MLTVSRASAKQSARHFFEFSYVVAFDGYSCYSVIAQNSTSSFAYSRYREMPPMRSKDHTRVCVC